MHAQPLKKPTRKHSVWVVFGRRGKESFHWWRCIDVHRTGGLPVRMHVWMDICMYLAGREGKRYVRLHALSLTAPIAAAHPIASPFLDQGPPPPASHSRTRQFCMERTMDLLYHIQLRTPSRPNGRPRQPFLQALLPSIRTCRLPMLSLHALLAAALCFFPASCLAGPP